MRWLDWFPTWTGRSSGRRRLLASIIESRLLYATPVWIVQVVASARSRANLVRPQRSTTLKVICAYRTVSDKAALLLASMPPADLVGLETQMITSRLAETSGSEAPPLSKNAVKRGERKVTIDLWQARWLVTTKTAWTRTVIPNVGRWLGKTVPKVPMSYYMTRALMGQGCFQRYLFRMDRAASPDCVHYGHEVDDVNHTLLECEYFCGHRVELEDHLGRSPCTADMPNVLCGPDFEGFPTEHEEKGRVLLEAEEDFRLFYRMVESIMTLKELEERTRQADEGRRQNMSTGRRADMLGWERTRRWMISEQVF